MIFALAALYFIYLGFFAGLNAEERKRVVVMFVLFIACAMFWAGFEQAGASLNLFADRYTVLNVFGWDMAAGTLQTINPLFIIIFAPVFAAIWVQLGARNLDPSAPVKFALGLILMGIGFYVMVLASNDSHRGAVAAVTGGPPAHTLSVRMRIHRSRRRDA